MARNVDFCAQQKFQKIKGKGTSCFLELRKYHPQRDFILGSSTVKPIKRKTPSKSPRAKSLEYKLNGHSKCKLLFLHTLDISNQMVYTAHENAMVHRVWQAQRIEVHMTTDQIKQLNKTVTDSDNTFSHSLGWKAIIVGRIHKKNSCTLFCP